MQKLTTAYIAFGSNVGDRKNHIDTALNMLAQTPDVKVVTLSQTIETVPLADADQPEYLNAVAQISTTLTAKKLHQRLRDIETSLGRTRPEKWSPRTIDLDLLLFADAIINTPDLTVPHPQMHLRSFVLSGLCQLNTRLVHPLIKESVSELATRLNGADFVLRPDVPQLISIAGIIGVGKTTLTERLSAPLGGNTLFEPYDKNPFLPQVYAGKKEMALDSQMFFLASRVEQLSLNVLTPGQIILTDYLFQKEIIYAGQLLNPAQRALHRRKYQSFEGQVCSPVLVIYLQDSVENCLKRIHRRNRPYEQVISTQFLEKLSTDYERLFADWKLCPVIRLSMSQFDCTRNGDIEHLTSQIRSYVVA